MGTQHLNSDSVRAEAARALSARWGFWEGYSHAKVLRILAREHSEHLRGAQLLAEDYTQIFGMKPARQVLQFGALTPLVPMQVDECGHKSCTRDALPGNGMCGRHGGSYMTEDERKHLVELVTQRLVGMSDRALGVLEEILDTGKSEKVRADIALAILDRAGAGPTTKLNVSVSQGADEATAELRANLERLSARLSQPEPGLGPVVEAELVEEPDADG